MNWLTKLERKYGRICIPNLISILVGAQILVYAVELFVNQYISLYLSLNRTALLVGQLWRVITFVFVPFSGGGPLSVVLGIYFTWFIGSALENEWGDFRFNLYILLGMVGLSADGLRRYLLPVPVAAAGLCHALPGDSGAALLRHPYPSEVLRPVRGSAVAAQLPRCRGSGQTELSALHGELPRLLWPAGVAQCPRVGPP